MDSGVIKQFPLCTVFLVLHGFSHYLKFCANTISSRYQDRIFVTSCFQIKEASKSSKLCIAACQAEETGENTKLLLSWVSPGSPTH